VKKLIIPLEAVIIALPIIAWRFGVISLARLGDVMITFGVLGFVLFVLAILDLRIPLGDVSRFLSLGEIEAIKRANAKPSAAFVLQLFVLVIFPLTVGILIRLFS
jgi:hypothetical protein